MTNARKQEWIAKMSGRLTDEDLVAIEDASRRASPAPWILAVTPEEWGQEELAANQTKMVREGGARAHFCIHPEDAEAQQARVTAFCGNGPTSEANARFIEIAVVAVPMLVREIRRLRALSPVESPGEEGADAVCTGLSASWCPIHGDCTCAHDEGTQDRDSPACPLHAAGSDHPRPAPAAAESTRADLAAENVRLVERVCELQRLLQNADLANRVTLDHVRNLVASADRAADPREVEEVRDALLDAAKSLEWISNRYVEDNEDAGEVLQEVRSFAYSRASVAREAAVEATRLSSPSGEALERGDGLAPWYEADGSTAMLPAEEVERRRKLAAKVLAQAHAFRADFEAHGRDGVALSNIRPLFAALDDLDARPSPRGTGTEGGK